MRKFLTVAMLGAFMLLASCNKLRSYGSSDNYDTSDSVQVAEFVDELTNPHLMDVAEVLTLKQSMLEKAQIDSVFVSMTDDTLRNVVAVLAKDKTLKNGFTKKDIIDEYQRCRRVYDNLPTTASVDKNATDLGQRRDSGNNIIGNNGGSDRIISTSYSFRTDTIGGKPVKIRIQTIESYE